MDKFGKWFIGYLLKQSNKTTAWIGFIGIILFFLHFHSLLVVLFLALVIMPEKNFSDTVHKWATDLQNLGKNPK